MPSLTIQRPLNPMVSIELFLDQVPPTDWFRILDDLARAGWKPPRISVMLGVALSTVQGWQQGSQPHHDTGKKLLILHELVCQKDGIPVVASGSPGV